VRDRRDVADRRDLEADGLKRTERALAARCAAYGVDLRLPLKPIIPAELHAMALPCASVMVIMVLLKLAFTCATPAVMFLRSLLRRRCGAWAI
jgi:hypothetical protein